MALEIFSGKRDVDTVAYDLAMKLAIARNPNSSPKEVMALAKELFTDCLEVAKELHKEETKDIGYIGDVTFRR